MIDTASPLPPHSEPVPLGLPVAQILRGPGRRKLRLLPVPAAGPRGGGASGGGGVGGGAGSAPRPCARPRVATAPHRGAHPLHPADGIRGAALALQQSQRRPRARHHPRYARGRCGPWS